MDMPSHRLFSRAGKLVAHRQTFVAFRREVLYYDSWWSMDVQLTILNKSGIGDRILSLSTLPMLPVQRPTAMDRICLPTARHPPQHVPRLSRLQESRTSVRSTSLPDWLWAKSIVKFPLYNSNRQIGRQIHRRQDEIGSGVSETSPSTKWGPPSALEAQELEETSKSDPPMEPWLDPQPHPLVCLLIIWHTVSPNWIREIRIILLFSIPIN